MLTKLKRSRSPNGGGLFAIVASRYNGRYVDAMLRAATRELKAVKAEVRVLRVPGAFEIPAVAARLAAAGPIQDPPLAGIICLGVIFQGQTSHAQHIGWGVTHALAQIQVKHQFPVIHAVFTFENEEHARTRCLGKEHNRGTEAARTALAMAKVMRSV